MLVEPCEKFVNSYMNFAFEYKANNLSDFFLNSYSAEELEKMIDSLAGAQLILNELKNNTLDENATAVFVPVSQFWLIDCGIVMGVGNIRHYLNPALEFYGGHIGYGVKLGYHARGLGTLLLKLLLQKSRCLGLKTVLLTCSAANIASRRVIEKNGGVFFDTSSRFIDGQQRLAHRFLIDTGLVLSQGFPLKNHAILYQTHTEGYMALSPYKAVDEGGRIVSFYFHILLGTSKAGWLVLRAADEPLLYYDGNIGYFIKPEYRGKGYAKRACLLIGSNIARVGVTQLTITCDADNAPSRRICQALGAKFIEVALPPTDKKLKCRYLWRLI